MPNNSPYCRPTIATVALLAIGFAYAIMTKEQMKLVDWSEYWASVISVGALIWLAFGYLQQGKSIEIQNKNIELQQEQIMLNKLDLQNQKKQIELQSTELKKMSFSFSLSHIREMISIAQTDYKESIKPKNPLYLNENIKSIMEDTDPRKVFQHCQEWQDEYKPYLMFIKRIRDAAEFYFISNGIEYNKNQTCNDCFLKENSHLFNKIPYISEAYNSISLQVMLNSARIDVPKQVQLAAFSAQYFLNPTLIRVEELHKDAQYFTDIQKPAIYKALVKEQETKRTQ